MTLVPAPTAPLVARAPYHTGALGQSKPTTHRSKRGLKKKTLYVFNVILKLLLDINKLHIWTLKSLFSLTVPLILKLGKQVHVRSSYM